MSFKSQLKPLICKYSDSNEAGVNDFLAALIALSDAQLRL